MDEQGGTLDFIALPENATQGYLHRVNLDGGVVRRLSPADQPGTHSYIFSGDTKFAVHAFSNMTTLPVMSLITLPDHKSIRILKFQKSLREKLAKLKLPKIEFLKVGIGNGIMLDAWILSDAALDTTKKHPLLMHVYGEPAGQTVKDVWGGQRFLWHAMLAQQGYVVASVDTRSTPGPRGQNWGKPVYGQLGTMSATHRQRTC